MLPGIRKKDKLGVSIMIGYVLLITLAVVMGVIAYNWMKTECQEGTSIIVESAAFSTTDSKLTITLKNNGRFDIAGYLIYGANSSGQKATIDLSGYLDETVAGKKIGTAVLIMQGSGNSFVPNAETTNVFNIPSQFGSISLVSITPMRLEETNNKEKLVNCVNARTEQNVG
jgi:hypothetical protein